MGMATPPEPYIDKDAEHYKALAESNSVDLARAKEQLRELDRRMELTIKQRNKAQNTIRGLTAERDSYAKQANSASLLVVAATKARMRAQAESEYFAKLCSMIQVYEGTQLPAMIAHHASSKLSHISGLLQKVFPEDATNDQD